MDKIKTPATRITDAELNELLREVVKGEILKDARPTLESLKALHADRPLLVLALDQAIDAITELTVATDQSRVIEAGKLKWIPVSKLPDEEDDYLVQYGFNDDTGPFISTAEFFPEGDDPAGWLIHRTSSESAEVIAWTRLPDTEGE